MPKTTRIRQSRREPLQRGEVESELAANLLEITDEQELDQFIGSLLKKARRVVGGALKSPLLRPLGGFIKGAIKKALPIAGGALGNLVAPGIGGQIGSQLASGAGGLLGLEFEGVAPEDQEFEVAKHLVRMAGSAVQNAAQTPAAGAIRKRRRSPRSSPRRRPTCPGCVQPQAAGHRDAAAVHAAAAGIGAAEDRPRRRLSAPPEYPAPCTNKQRSHTMQDYELLTGDEFEADAGEVEIGR